MKDSVTTKRKIPKDPLMEADETFGNSITYWGALIETTTGVLISCATEDVIVRILAYGKRHAE